MAKAKKSAVKKTWQLPKSARKATKPPVEEAPAPAPDDPALPLIPLAKKQASRDDSPLEKEIRRFNRLVKQLQEMEEGKAREKENEERYAQLYQQQVIPELVKLAQAKYRFMQQAHVLFGRGKFSKSEQKTFTQVALTLLREAEEFVPEALELLQHYMSLQVSFMSKREKEQLDRLMEGEGFGPGFTKDFDINEKREQGQKIFGERFNQQHEEFFEQRKEEHRENKKAAHEHTDINTLYKELAKLLHPDLEQDETLRHEKEQLMKEVVQARNDRDLHALLVLRSKARKFLEGAGRETKESSYTLEQLKRYNRELKQKLEAGKSRMVSDIFETIFMGGPFAGPGGHAYPEQEIKRELKEIKGELREIEHEIKLVRTPADLKEFITIQKEYERRGF